MEEFKRNFTKREIEKANEARRLFIIMGRPSQKVFEDMIKNGKLINNTVTVQNCRNAIQIYGVDLGVLKGNTTKTKPDHMSVVVFNKLKPKNIVLSIDVMFFTGLTFLTTVCRNNRFITATILSDRKKKTIMESIQQAIRLYRTEGMK